MNRKVPQAYSPADDYAGSLTAFGMTIIVVDGDKWTGRGARVLESPESEEQSAGKSGDLVSARDLVIGKARGIAGIARNRTESPESENRA